MAPERREDQLELFDVSHQAAPRLHRESLGRMWFQVRYDQLVLGGIASVLGLTVVFALGVERGKQLVRWEGARSAGVVRPARRAPPVAPIPAVTPVRAPRTGERTAVAATAPSTPNLPAPKAPTAAAAIAATAHTGPTPPADAAQERAPATPSDARKSGGSRYAVQVVTYRQATLAKREMERLRARGEQAFLLMRNGRTMVFVGPFPSKGNAAEKLTTLRPRYHDCFIKPS